MRPRKSFRRFLAAMVLMAACAPAQQAQKAEASGKLREVLGRLDRTATEFRSAEASFEWDQYQRVTGETDKQQGKIYFRRAGGGMQMAAYVTEPPPAKTVLFGGGKVQLYQTSSDHIDVYDTSKNSEAVESFLVLGFGGTGQDMVKSFDVSYGGPEKVNGIDTDKLELVPKTEKVKGVFNHIELWIDSRGISVWQKFVSPEGDYRLARYSDIVLNKKIADSVFKLKTPGNVLVENH
jgi:outer membrane lipoprotein-sorting protein